MSVSTNQRILALLKDNPRGLSIREISEKIKINRNSVSNYLNILLVSGMVEVREIGPSKVFYLSQRIPLSAMLNIYSDSVLVVNSTGKIVQVNDTLLQLIGKNREEIGNMSYTYLFSFFVTDSVNLINESVNSGLNGEESNIDVSGTWKDKTSHFNVKFIPTVFADGENGVTIIAKDVTEERLAVESVRESEALFSVLFEHMSDGLVLIDAGGEILKANPAAEEILGLKKVDIEDRSYSASEWEVIGVDGAHLPVEERAVHRSMKEKTSVSGVVMGVIRPDGNVSWISVDSVPILNGEGEVDLLVGTFKLLKITKEKTCSISSQQ